MERHGAPTGKTPARGHSSSTQGSICALGVPRNQREAGTAGTAPTAQRAPLDIELGEKESLPLQMATGTLNVPLSELFKADSADSSLKQGDTQTQMVAVIFPCAQCIPIPKWV